MGLDNTLSYLFADKYNLTQKFEFKVGCLKFLLYDISVNLGHIADNVIADIKSVTTSLFGDWQ